MKKIILAVVIVIATTATSFAAPVTSNRSALAFSKDFKAAENATWQTAIDFDLVTFDLDGAIKTAFYDKDGNLLVTSEIIPAAALPANAQIALADRYAAFNIVSVSNLEGPSIEEGYYIVLEKGNERLTLRSDEDGNLGFVEKVKMLPSTR